MPTHLLVLRHGQSTWNAERRWQGRADPALSPLGVRQAKEAAAALGAFDLVAASPLQRAAHTAEIITRELGIGPVVHDDDLQERSAGAYEGLTKPEIEARWPGRLAAGPDPEGWEDDDEVILRAVGALGRLAAIVADGTALVIAHGGVLRCLDRALGDPDRPIPNLSGRWYRMEPGSFVGGEYVETISADLASVTSLRAVDPADRDRV